MACEDYYKQFMQEALVEAHKALERDEVPIGAVIVKSDEVIARGHNRKEGLRDPTAHAEVTAIKRAANRLQSWRLTDTVLYVTLEPCTMCLGAILEARLAGVVFGAYDSKSGALGSLIDATRFNKLNHRLKVVGGLLADESIALLRAFFMNKRNANAKDAKETERWLSPVESARLEIE